MDPLEFVINYLEKNERNDLCKEILLVFLKNSNDFQQLDVLSKLFFDIKEYNISKNILERMLDKPESKEHRKGILTNLIKVNTNVNDLENSLNIINELIMDDNSHDLLLEKAVTLFLLGRKKESEDILDIIIKESDDTNLKNRCFYNKASHIMDNGDYSKGLYDFIDYGHKLNIWKNPNIILQRWNGIPKKDQKIVIYGQGGIGDEIIALRFIHNFKDLGMDPIYFSLRDDIKQLCKSNNIKCITKFEEIPYDAVYELGFYCPLSLKIKDFTNKKYLTPNPVYVEKWKKILPEGKKIGLRWKGNQYYEHELHRSIDLKLLHKELDFNDTSLSFISIQKEDYSELEDYPTIINVADKLETLEDLLACVSLLDYTFTSCTSIAHILGSADLPFTVFPPVGAYYVWLGNSNWYNNVKIRRQQSWKSNEHLKGIKKDIP